MQSKVKLTKRQVKEDRFTTFMLTSKDKLQSELESKWQYYVVGFVLIVVLIWAVAWQLERQAASDIEAGEALSRAIATYQSGDEQVAILELTQILQDYGNSDEAATAVFLLGNANLSVRNYGEAIRYYQMYLDDFGGNKLDRAAALAGIAAAQEDQGQYAEAAASFVLAAEAFPGGPLEPDYELGALRNYLTGGNTDLAEARLTVLVENYDGTDWANRANRLFAEKRISE